MSQTREHEESSSCLMCLEYYGLYEFKLSQTYEHVSHALFAVLKRKTLDHDQSLITAM